MSKPEFGDTGAGLSQAGERRREEILGTLQRAMTSHRRRRKVLRAAGGLAAMVLVVGTVALLVPRAVTTTGPTTPRPIATGTEGPEKAGRTSAMITVVRDDPGILERVAIRRTSAVTVIDDDELSLLMEEAGRPSGLVRTRGRVYLAADFGPPKAPGMETVN